MIRAMTDEAEASPIEPVIDLVILLVAIPFTLAVAGAIALANAVDSLGRVKPDGSAGRARHPSARRGGPEDEPGWMEYAWGDSSRRD